MIINYWPASFRSLYGGELPRNYLAFDLETTGYSFNQDVITEWGHCLVRDGEVVNRLNLVIDWSEHPVVADHWLRQRLNAVKESMNEKGLVCSVDYERMKKEGLKPDQAFAFILDFLDTLSDQDIYFVAHGGYTFDEKMLAANLAGFGYRKDFTFGDNRLIDTEAIEKASQVPTHDKMHPLPSDTLRSYFMRVKYARLSGIKSNMFDHCYKKYNFAAKGLKPEDMHGAGADAYCCHLLMEEFRSRLSDTILDKKSICASTLQRPTLSRQAREATPVATGPGTRIRKQRNN